MLPVLSQSDSDLTACFVQDIAALLESFPDDASASKQSLHQMLSSDKRAFSRASVRVLAKADGSAGVRYLLHLLRSRSLLMPALTDPMGCKREDAISAGRAISGMGIPLDADLEATLSVTLGEGNPAGNSSRVIRLLQLLEAASSHPRFYLFQTELLSYPDTEVRSKSALLICRTSKSATLVGRMMLDEDPRVQANAVEALWAFDAADATPLLLTAARSKTPRVAANAAVGLYRIGDLSALRLMFKMAQSSEVPRRISAAWAMGETGDPRFLPCLTKWFTGSTGAERVNILQALGRIRRREKSLIEAGTIEIRSWDAHMEGTERRLLLSLWSADPTALSTLKPTQFAIWEGETLVQDYEVAAQPNAGLAISGFVLPRFSSVEDAYGIAVLDGIARCLRYKRPEDLWRVDRYLVEPRNGEHSGPLEKAAIPYDESLLGPHAKMHRGFLAAPETLRKIIESPGSKERATDDAIAAFDRQSDAMIKFSGKRKLFLFLASGCDRHLDRHLNRLLSFITNERIALHGIASKGATGCEKFEQLCRASEGGSFAELAPEAVAAEVERIYARSTNRFDVTYRIPEHSEPLEGRIQITSENGCGRGSFRFTGA
jgi:hypothetical protein